MPKSNQYIASETYHLTHQKDGQAQMRVTIDYDKKKATLHKVGAAKNDRSGDAFNFIDSDPTKMQRIGELIADAGELAAKELERTEGNASEEEAN